MCPLGASARCLFTNPTMPVQLTGRKLLISG